MSLSAEANKVVFTVLCFLILTFFGESCTKIGFEVDLTKTDIKENRLGTQPQDHILPKRRLNSQMEPGFGGSRLGGQILSIQLDIKEVDVVTEVV